MTSRGRSGPSRGQPPFGDRPGQGNAPSAQPQLPPDYLRGGYFDQNGYLRVEVVTHWAKSVAKVLIGTNPKNPRMKSAQLRNFYEKAKVIQRRLKAEEPFDSLRAEVASLERDAAYAVGRENSPAPPSFKEWMDRNLELALRDAKNFLAFVEHFESVVAFHRYLEWQGSHR